MQKSWPHLFPSLVIVLLLSACSGLGGGLPAPEAVIARHLEAVYPAGQAGAEAAISMKGMLHIDEFGVEAPITLKLKAPDKRLFSARVMGQDVLRSCSETQCWSKELNAPTVRLQGAELAFMQELADFHRLQQLSRYYRAVKTLGRREFNGVPAYELQLIRNNGNEDRWYFAQESGLWLGGVWQLPADMGGTRITQTFEGYRNFDGIYVATKITEVAPTQTSLMVIDEVSFEPIADELFEIGDQ